MKQGTTYPELIARVEREAEARRDFYAPVNELRLQSEGNTSRLLSPCGEFAVRETAHAHLSELVAVDRRYYQRLREQAPELLDQNVNYWLSRSNDKPRVIRALDTDARAIVSPRYATLDNDALLRTVEPIISALDATVESAEITDERLIIKVASPRLQGDVQIGDAVQVGIVIQNSEVRAGAVAIDLFVKRLVCSNGMIVPGKAGVGARRRHVGRSWPDSGDSGLVPENIERAAWEAQVWEGIQDDIRHAVSQDAFGALLDRLRATTSLQTTLEPREVIERLGSQYKLSESVQQIVLGHLVAEGYDGTLWTVINSVTRAAQDVESYEVATDLEALGGRLAHLSPREWTQLTNPN